MTGPSTPLVVAKCSHCNNMLPSLEPAPVPWEFCEHCAGLGATIRPDHVHTPQGRRAYLTLIGIRRRRRMPKDRDAALAAFKRLSAYRKPF